MNNKKLTKREVMANDIKGIMQNVFPYYESDDKDDFIYLVKKQDISTAAHRIVRYFESTPPQSEKGEGR